ncbi:MAG TPA: TolC family outer membrane protein [Rhodocyclaceae bacterium]|jgi:outer membrane protein|nr:TolC family outer membrane protein [Rhodocyclaceae bacterium]
MKPKAKTALLASALAAMFAAAPTRAADLLQVYQDALGYDAQYAAARYQRDAGLERLPQARAGLLPNVSLGGNTTYNDNDITFRTDPPQGGTRKFNSHAYQVQLSQPLFRWQNWVQYGQAKIQVAQAEAQYQNAKQDLIVRVVRAYFDVLLAEVNVAVAKQSQEAIGQQLEQAKKNFEVGVATITDTHEAQSRLDLATAQVIAAENDLAVKRNALRVITGKEPEVLSTVRRGAELQRPQPDDVGKWVESAEQNNYLVQIQQMQTEVARLEVDRNRAGHYPTVDLVATYGQSAAGSSLAGVVGIGNDLTASTIGVQVNVPIYQGGAVVSRTREAAALNDKALQDLESARRNAAQGARQSYLGVTSGLAQVAALRQAVVSSTSSFESNKLGYEVGVRINIDVLNAQNQVAAAERDLARALYDTLISQLQLKSAAGTLGDEDVRAINEILAK